MVSDITSPSVKDDGRAVLKLLIRGFTVPERDMLHAVVRLSKKRAPAIELITNEDVAQADVVMIDAADPESRGWANNLPWLQEKAIIWVDAIESNGACVIKRPVAWHTIPKLMTQLLSVKTAGIATTAKPKAAEMDKHASVLVVDDSIAVRSMLRSLLESQGLSVIDVDNGHSALKLASETQFDCVLLDVMMPGMDGYEACRKIKSNAYNGNPPAVVMLTSKSSPFDKIRGKMAGSDAYLTKPIKPEYLTEVVQKHVAMSSNVDRQSVLQYL